MSRSWHHNGAGMRHRAPVTVRIPARAEVYALAAALGAIVAAVVTR